MINKIKKEIFSYFPNYLNVDEKKIDEVIETAQEIRIRVGQPIVVRNYMEEKEISYEELCGIKSERGKGGFGSSNK